MLVIRNNQFYDTFLNKAVPAQFGNTDQIKLIKSIEQTYTEVEQGRTLIVGIDRDYPFSKDKFKCAINFSCICGATKKITEYIEDEASKTDALQRFTHNLNKRTLSCSCGCQYILKRSSFNTLKQFFLK